MDGAVVQVAVRAFIGTAELDKDLEAMGLLMARKGMPRTMVLIAEQNIGMAAPRAVWMRGESALVSADLRIAETTVLDALKNGGVCPPLHPPNAAGEKGEGGGGARRDNPGPARRAKAVPRAGGDVLRPGRT